ncbi:hypothetical protein DdX_10730 [Ditylenchus destructor]|uniref:Uncharacterized protein n=1 Tax=Ditylenchus destructor TaxID=166010 RepID=A0AAD4QYX4_9BILA|nr:hypothetical protein DdX_10730 [Ditylenchus destructor]
MGYGWAVILLCSFIFCVLLASVVMFVLYSNNRRRDINLRQRLAEFENTAPIGMRSEGDMSNTLGSLSSDVYSPSNGSQVRYILAWDQKSPPFHQVYHIYRPGSDTYRSPTFPSTYHQFSSQYWPKSVF